MNLIDKKLNNKDRGKDSGKDSIYQNNFSYDSSGNRLNLVYYDDVGVTTTTTAYQYNNMDALTNKGSRVRLPIYRLASLKTGQRNLAADLRGLTRTEKDKKNFYNKSI